MNSLTSQDSTNTVLAGAVGVVAAGALAYTTHKYWQYQNSSRNSSTPVPEELLESDLFPRSSMIVLNQIVDAFIPAISEEELDNGGFSLIDQSFKSRFLPKFGEENTDMSSSVMNITTTQHSRALLLSGAKELGVAKVMAEAMQKLLLKEEQAQVQLLLQLMSSSWGNFLINGYSLGFQNMTLEDRVAALRALRDSYIPQLRSAYQVFKRLTGSLFTAYPFTQSLNKYGLKSNPNWYAMGYEPGVTMNKQATSTKTKQITQVPKPIESIDEIKEGGERRKGDGSNSSNSGNSSSNRRVYDADVVVVGSGAGGGTIAAQLVKAGHKVLVLEKGSYYSAEQFKNWTEAEAFEQAFERGGLCATKDGNIIILAGATVGGGTQVNWSASFRTPDYVRRRWANTHTGMLAFKDGGEFEAALDEAHELFNVNTDFVNKPSAATTDVEDLVKVKAGGQLKEIGKGCPSYLHSAAEGICNDGPSIGYHLSLDTNDTTTLNEITALGGGSEGEDKSGGICINLNNEILCKGAAAEGLHAEVIPRNTLGCVDCGHCCHGCPYGAKQSTVTSQLEPLASTGSLHLLPNCYVDKVLIENKKACGVEGYITTGSNEVDGEVGGKISIKVNAKIVVSSGGSLHTPCLLLRSGLKNAHIGRHIALHPVVAVGGFFGLDRLRDLYGPGNEPSTDRVSTGLASGISMGIVVRSNLSEKEKKTGAASFCEPRYGKALTASLTRERTHGIFKSPAIETPPLHPGILGLGLPWNDGLAFKTCLLMHKQMAAFIAISRDLSSYQNRVTLSAEGYPVIEYALTTLDADMVMEGLVMQMRMMRGAGSSIVFPLHESNEWISSTISDKAFEIKINEVKKDGIQPHKMQLFSAHQMGSCRMSPKESEGPVKETGETYEVSNLFVADGSVLPTSLGINPMITIEAMAIMIAKNVNKSLAIM